MNPFSTIKDLADTLRANDAATEEMHESLMREIQEKHEGNRLSKEADQSQIDSLPVQKETLEETKKNVQVSVHSARVALVSAVIAVVALMCQIVFFLLLR